MRDCVSMIGLTEYWKICHVCWKIRWNVYNWIGICVSIAYNNSKHPFRNMDLDFIRGMITPPPPIARTKIWNKAQSTIRVRTGFGEFWKVKEIENTIFQVLDSFGKERIFKMAMEKFWILIWKNYRNILKWT